MADPTRSGALGTELSSAVSEPQIFVLLEASRPTAAPTRHRLTRVDQVHIGRDQARDAWREGASLHITLPDPWMSSRHARVVRQGDDYLLEDLGSKNGTLVNGRRIEDQVTLSPGDLIEVGRSFLLLEPRSTVYSDDPDDTDPSRLCAGFEALATFHTLLRGELDALSRVAASGLPILVLGETGTGKEVVARAIHQLSGRLGRFVAVNVAALADTLIEAELFGAKKGAYSGADEDRIGLFRAADQGTLFLDEIGDLPLASQPAFLRALQEREVLPVGDTRPVPVSFRLVAATHQNLERLVARDRFRSDLLARVSGLRVHLPALSARRTDLGFIIGRLLERLAGDRATRLSFSALAGRALLTYPWPRNIRELVNALSTALALAPGDALELEHLPPEVRARVADSASPRRSDPAAERRAPPAESEEDLDDRRRQTLVRLLVTHQGNISAVAREMGCARMQIHRWLKSYQIDPDAYRPAP